MICAKQLSGKEIQEETTTKVPTEALDVGNLVAHC